MKKNSEKSFAQGYELAQNEFNKLSLYPKTSVEWVVFFHDVIQNLSDMDGICGVAAFITSNEAKNINVGLFNKELSSLGKVSEQYAYDTRIIDCLLPRPNHLDEYGTAIEIPKDLRPDYHYDSLFDHGTGKLGRIYMKEVGMHMYLPHCDIYDSDDPEMLLCSGDQLDETSVKISELLTVLQSILDPEKKNQKLTKAIERCKDYENGGSSLPGILKKHGIGVVNLSANGWHQINYQQIHSEAFYTELDNQGHLQVTLNDKTERTIDATEKGFDLSNFIREAINRARNTQS